MHLKTLIGYSYVSIIRKMYLKYHKQKYLCCIMFYYYIWCFWINIPAALMCFCCILLRLSYFSYFVLLGNETYSMRLLYVCVWGPQIPVMLLKTACFQLCDNILCSWSERVFKELIYLQREIKFKRLKFKFKRTRVVAFGMKNCNVKK